MNENELADKILEWYWANKDKINKNKRFWFDNPVGNTIRSVVKEQKRWKFKARGKSDISHFTPANGFELDF